MFRSAARHSLIHRCKKTMVGCSSLFCRFHWFCLAHVLFLFAFSFVTTLIFFSLLSYQILRSTVWCRLEYVSNNDTPRVGTGVCDDGRWGRLRCPCWFYTTNGGIRKTYTWHDPEYPCFPVILSASEESHCRATRFFAGAQNDMSNTLHFSELIDQPLAASANMALNTITGISVGADVSRTPPIHRPSVASKIPLLIS